MGMEDWGLGIGDWGLGIGDWNDCSIRVFWGQVVLVTPVLAGI